MLFIYLLIASILIGLLMEKQEKKEEEIYENIMGLIYKMHVR